MNEYTVNDPMLGKRLWRVSDCAACNGTGAQWHQGCDGQSANCNRCGGFGQTGVYKDVGLDGKPYGQWKTED
jgi:DnaJ-class molecular chaperone